MLIIENKAWGVFTLLKKFFNSLSGGRESIEELYDEIENLREECDSLNEVMRRKDAKINKLYSEIETLEKELEEKGTSVKIDKNLLEKLEQELKNRDYKIKDLETQNKELENRNKELEEKTKELSKDIRIDLVEEKDIDPDFVNYKLLISDYYEARKFESFKKACENRGLVYMEELDNIDFDDLPITDTKIKNARLYYEEYKKGYYDLDIKTHMIKGEKVNKVFFRFRSFVKFCKKSNYNYMIELDNLDFDKLIEHNFNEGQIEKLKNKLSEYNELKRIKI